VSRGAIAEVSLSAIAQNFHTVKKIVKNRPVIAVVKADAYGHGAREVSRRLLHEGAESLAVAYLGEAIQLRESGIQAPIILLFDTPHLDEYIHYRLTPVLYSYERAHRLSQEAEKRNALLKVHVKVDTGMGRLGLHGNHALHDLLAISELPGLEIDAMMSHFSEADLADRSFAMEQLAKFTALRQALTEKLKRNIFSHMANSAAVLALEKAHLDAVRPGIMLYGYSPLLTLIPSGSPADKVNKNGSEPIELIPAMKIKTRILCLRNVPAGTPISYGRTYITKRPSRIGVLPVGYADGYSRRFSNNAYVLVKGKRVPVVGRVCMDTTMTDMTEVGDIQENEEVVLLGKQKNEGVTADELAQRADTISYDILTCLGNRARRIYAENY
jgi:alanine racemase